MRIRPSWAVAVFLLAACGGPEKQGDSGTPGAGGTGGSTDRYSWNEPTPGVTVGPFSEFKLFRAGCGEQLWGRWIVKGEFVLAAKAIRTPAGDTLSETYFEAPRFTDGMTVVFLLADKPRNTFADGRYALEFTVRDAAGNETTHHLDVSTDAGIFRRDAVLTGSGATNRLAGDFAVTITPHLDGNVGRIFVYDGQGDGCLVQSKVFFEAPTLTREKATEVVVADHAFPSGRYASIWQGADDAKNAQYFATIDFSIP